MKSLIFSRLLFSMVLLGAAFLPAEEDLDAAMEAQKQKASRRVYSERIQMADQNLVVPKTQSEEELALDRELEKLENQLTRQALPTSQINLPRAPAPVPVKTENWLTPSLMDPKSANNSPSKETDADWINQELDRQKAIKQWEKQVAEEEALVNKLLREDSRQGYSIEKNPIVPFETSLRNTLTPGATLSVTPGVSRTSPFSPLKAVQPQETRQPSRPAGRSDSGVIKSSFSFPSSAPSPAQRPGWQAPLGSSAQKMSDFTLDRNITEPTPLPPLKRIRRAEPANPFDDDFTTKFKTSIWD